MTLNLATLLEDSACRHRMTATGKFLERELAGR